MKPVLISKTDRTYWNTGRYARITTYNFAAESVCDRGEGKPELVVLRRLNVG